MTTALDAYMETVKVLFEKFGQDPALADDPDIRAIYNMARKNRVDPEQAVKEDLCLSV